ncbi:HEXXH motif domain-containing protein [Amycolatopsis rhizosphaerae]|uniref:HEXXH motif domain-containing protein n=1 Tax=Amycolatopsis rhizosphaerae TaxID=2053003 RepID=UPI001643D39E|nr:HEXXH motif domain-containing protein [Amycolatopsis rhizosphaerae]
MVSDQHDVISLPHLHELSTGFGSADAVLSLADGQRDLRRALVASVYRAAEPLGADRAAWTLINQLDHSHPDVLDGVLGHPYLRAWAERCLSRPPVAATSHLASFAAAAAILAGVAACLDVPVIEGRVFLPTLGTVLVDPEASIAVLSCDHGAVAVWAGGAEVRLDSGTIAPLAGADASWLPSRTLYLGDFTVRLEDGDPCRDDYHRLATGCLPDSEVDRWRSLCADAWALIERDYPQYVPGITAGLRAVIPLRSALPGQHTSGTVREAFGAVGIARPDDPEALALLLIREFQQVKICGILDLIELYERSDRDRYRVGRCPDPQPLEGVLRGAYAHLGVTDFWRVRRRTAHGAAAEEADGEFTRSLSGTAEAIETLLHSGSLNPTGLAFVEGMRSTTNHW